MEQDLTATRRFFVSEDTTGDGSQGEISTTFMGPHILSRYGHGDYIAGFIVGNLVDGFCIYRPQGDTNMEFFHVTSAGWVLGSEHTYVPLYADLLRSLPADLDKKVLSANEENRRRKESRGCTMPSLSQYRPMDTARPHTRLHSYGVDSEGRRVLMEMCLWNAWIYQHRYKDAEKPEDRDDTHFLGNPYSGFITWGHEDTAYYMEPARVRSTDETPGLATAFRRVILTTAYDADTAIIKFEEMLSTRMS